MPTLPLPLPFQCRESPLLPTHGLPLTAIVFGYLESHLRASPHCIQRAAARTAAVWIPSSCPVRERGKHLVVAEKREKKKEKEKARNHFSWHTMTHRFGNEGCESFLFSLFFSGLTADKSHSSETSDRTG